MEEDLCINLSYLMGLHGLSGNKDPEENTTVRAAIYKALSKCLFRSAEKEELKYVSKLLGMHYGVVLYA